MLDEYILRGYAISAICRNCPMTDYCRMTGESCEDVKRIKAIPAANVAEVGYCSECVYHYDDGDHKCKKLRIPCPDDSEFFCKYGKKKEVNRMPNNDYIKIDLPIHYAEKNVAQCWVCKNCIGKKEFRADMRKDIYIPSKETRVLLPECRVTEQYMTFVYGLPCPHFEAIGGKNDAD